ncbi:hypothetical protein [Pseudaquabacterium pictum]|uniref:DUF2867 domain-containing protein n=1 Tax=Pseudaquabacterium pictum TaxID=2315236 RepID=A0A480AH37_9BURK|nr:hypothetical protein [Rubrivivax pictus]GCL60941.1 hypothetical protein AQPW35_00220 [Rubrivivax pictus]
MPQPAPLPDGAFLADYARRGAYTDCFATTLPGRLGLAALVEAVYTSPLFKLERWVLATLLRLPSTDAQARQVALGHAERFAAWRVERRSDTQILLDAGQTRLWLAVAAGPAGAASTTLLFGSAVLPRRPGGRFGWLFHALVGAHRVYSRQLLAAAARRIGAVGLAQQTT